jgi:DNA polymerase-3 subunit gamma/tau
MSDQISEKVSSDAVDSSTSVTIDTGADTHRGSYVVVARRYRPQLFADLVGQEHIAQALAGAITQQRVGHAYLFTGARGVGKTSAARIFAKALNCVNGPTATPCNECDICRSVSSGDDVDVLEIDGASNRGIDEIRELRQNVNVRASRSRYKIYIIDEVHMLTREAFNALLKTLEEPPKHVKFIFCTTEAEKIPITILSRCQRFDFAGIQPQSILGRLRQIVTAEGVEADSEALEIIARRAAGSMRDSQSLLEQLLACGGDRLTADDVNRLLGTAGDKRLGQLVRQLSAGDAAGALAGLDRAVEEGVDVAQLLDQLLGIYRDLMVIAVGASSEALLHISPGEQPQMTELARQLGVETILAAMQVIDTSLARLRYTTRGRTLVELALVRLSRLGQLEDLSTLLSQLRDGTLPAVGELPVTRALPGAGVLPLPSADRSKAISERPEQHTTTVTSSTITTPTTSLSAEVKKKSAADRAALTLEPDRSEVVSATSHQKPLETVPSLKTENRPSVVKEAVSAAGSDATEDIASAKLLDPPASKVDDPAPKVVVTSENAMRVWQSILPQLSEMTRAMAAEVAVIAISAPNRLAASFPAAYTAGKSYCERVAPQIERALQNVTGQVWRVDYQLLPPVADGSPGAVRNRTTTGNRQRMQEAAQNPLVRRAVELFDARPVRLEEPG